MKRRTFISAVAAAAAAAALSPAVLAGTKTFTMKSYPNWLFRWFNVDGQKVVASYEKAEDGSHWFWNIGWSGLYNDKKYKTKLSVLECEPWAVEIMYDAVVDGKPVVMGDRWESPAALKEAIKKRGHCPRDPWQITDAYHHRLTRIVPPEEMRKIKLVSIPG